MNFRLVVRVLSFLLIFSGLAMLVPLLFSLYFGDGDHFALIHSIGINLLGGAALYYCSQGHTGELGHREGFAIVTFGWLVLAAFGCLPFIFGGMLPNPIDAFFETMSGYTTTGASVLTQIEGQPRGLLFWRSLTHWFGGMGVLVLATAILPFLGVGGMQLLKAEAPGPVTDKMTPRIASTAKLLWVVYVVLSLLETMLLMIGGMSLYEALCHTFGTMATGGFSTRNASVAAFDSLYIEIVIIAFMFLAGTNFSLHYRFLSSQNLKAFWRDEEFRFYLWIITIGSILVWLNLYFAGGRPSGESARMAAFQVVSITTTTGFCTADFDLWPTFSKFLLLLLMFVGGCAGSTGGAMKHVRILILMKHGLRELRKLILPGAVLPLRVSGKPVANEVVTNILGFFLLYMLVFVIATLLVGIILTGYQLETPLAAGEGPNYRLASYNFVTAFASVAATLGNIGPGFAAVGAVQNYAGLPLVVKFILTICMLIGRLEIFTVLVLFMPRFWKR